MTDQPTHAIRFRMGIALFVVGLLSPLLVPLVNGLALSTEWKATLSGLLLLGIPELLWVGAAGVMGKAGFDRLKSKTFGLLRRYLLPDKVSPYRYYVGLVMFTLPLLFGWLAPYVQHLVPTLSIQTLAWHLGFDLLLILSLFILGGEFWDKLRALFTCAATARFPQHPV
jgi:hypothetical protein